MNNIAKRLKMLPVVCAAAMTLGLTGCEDFLNRPDDSSYTLSDFYKSDEQCLQAANILYSVPWYDFFRGWIQVGETMSGNHYMGSNGFWRLTLKDGTVDGQLADMSASLWAVNARANTIIENINRYGGGTSTEVGRNTAKGEALVWKALAYFFMVRIYGAVPIVHNNTELMATGEYSSLYRIKINYVYDYIIMTLKKALEWLPETPEKGRVGKYAAYGLLAKVYLTKSGYGMSGSRNQDDLDQAAKYAKLVADHYEYWLEPEYADIFRGSGNFTREALISWRWVVASDSYWTAYNSLQSDLAIAGFDEYGSGGAWGNWVGPSLDLQAAFGEDATKKTRNNYDKRRKSTMMMYGDVYDGNGCPSFWRDHPTKAKSDGSGTVTFSNGFDWTMYCRDVLNSFDSSTGANAVKHLVGNNEDHLAEIGTPNGQMKTGLATHILRLADVYLILAEATLGNAESTTDATALRAFNAVRDRAGVDEKTSITFDDIFKERRLELAYEGDYWYDFVRLSYYKPAEAVAMINAQNRKNYIGLNDYYKSTNDAPYAGGDGLMIPRINKEEPPTGDNYCTPESFTVPFPETDLQMNPHLNEEPQDADISQYTYH
ncbi:MAG: RagB/SusD family nutrient uptake outer membrane protein [Prevotellaceae bacterium]|nr:RagB/SusD family nutrient uptake outer membrane protein [Prevotellaceae bacterium]